MTDPETVIQDVEQRYHEPLTDQEKHAIRRVCLRWKECNRLDGDQPLVLGLVRLQPASPPKCAIA